MNEPANHWKLGLFVVLGGVLLAVGIIYFGTASLRTETVAYTTYFDEAVTGLDVGSPVRFRGVNIGKVTGIAIAPDHRQVQITYGLGVSVLGTLRLAAPAGKDTKIAVPPDLRAQLGSAGVTGVKYILIDFFDVKSNPPPKLAFEVPENYIPAAQSVLKNLEDSVFRAIDQFPVITGQVDAILRHVDRMLIDIEGKHLPDKVTATLSNVDTTLANIDQTLAVARVKLSGVDTQGLSTEGKAALVKLSDTMTRAQELMARLDGDKGVLSSVQRATDNIGDVAGDARSYGSELSDTLRDLSEAAAAVRQLVEALELDSDMLLKGRAKASQP